jgi:hypothetical protein
VNLRSHPSAFFIAWTKTPMIVESMKLGPREVDDQMLVAEQHVVGGLLKTICRVEVVFAAEERPGQLLVAGERTSIVGCEEEESPIACTIPSKSRLH